MRTIPGNVNNDTVNHEKLDSLFQEHGFTGYKWIDPKKIIVAQWVRMKCMFGCNEYGKNCCCPPNVPAVSECERFFHEYSRAVIFHITKTVEKPEDRHSWSRKVNMDLSKLEREVFLSGYERAFILFMDSCTICGTCTGTKEECKNPQAARPGPESMAVDVYATVRQYGFPINVRTDYTQQMDRYSFLLID